MCVACNTLIRHDFSCQVNGVDHIYALWEHFWGNLLSLLHQFIVKAYTDGKVDISEDILKSSIAIIPAYNEEISVGRVVAGIRSLGLDALVVDDQSSDETGKQAEKSGAVVLNPAVRLGAWGAIQTGFRYAIKNGYMYGVTLDADGQHLPESISDILTEENVRDYDVVIGACPARVSRLRRIAWTWFRSISSTNLGDLTSGLRLYNRWSMRLMLDNRAYLFDYQDMGALLLLKKHGLRIKEAPVQMACREAGQSRVFSSWIKVGKYMIVTTILSVSKFRQKNKLDR